MFLRKKVGLALSGGVAKGFAHIGVLKVFERHNIPIDVISGTSIGSLIGAAYSKGFSTREIEKMVLDIKIRRFMDINLPRHGLIRGKKLEDHIREKLNNCSFSDLRIPLFITATDIENKEEVIFSKGNLTDAIRASISVPGIFNPKVINKRVLIDGGVTDPMPVSILREAGVDIVIAVNLNRVKPFKVIEEEVEKTDNTKLPSIYQTLFKTFEMIDMAHTISRVNSLKPDIMISPSLDDVGYQDFHKAKIAIKAGERATKTQIEEIKNIIPRRMFSSPLKWFKFR